MKFITLHCSYTHCISPYGGHTMEKTVLSPTCCTHTMDFNYPFGIVRVQRNTFTNTVIFMTTILPANTRHWLFVNETRNISKYDAVSASELSACALSSGIVALLQYQ